MSEVVVIVLRPRQGELIGGAVAFQSLYHHPVMALFDFAFGNPKASEDTEMARSEVWLTYRTARAH